MHKRRRILYPVHFSQAANETPAGGAPAGNGPLPGGVAQHSAAAQAAAAAAGGQQQTPPADDANRAGGPDALKADLASERAKRHELEQKLAAATQQSSASIEAIKTALGLGDATSPEQLKAAAEAAKGTAQSAQAQLAVFKLAKDAGGDAHALLDSASFLSSISGIDPSNSDAIKAAIKTAVDNNKSLAYQKVPPGGSRDAGQGAGGGSQQPTISDALRALAGK